MPGQTVVFEVAANHGKAMAAFLEIVQAAERTGRAGGQAGEEMKTKGDQAGVAWGRGLDIVNSYPAALLKMATGASAVYAAIALVREELERVNMLRASAMEKLDTSMEPYKRATIQFDPEYLKSDTFKRLSEEGLRSGVGANNYWSALADAMSASGGHISDQEAHETVNLIAKFAGKEALKPEDLMSFTGGMLDSIQAQRRRNEQTGVKQRVNAKELMGTMISSWPASRPTDMGFFATYELPMQNLLIQNSGFTRDEAASLASIYGSMMGDPWGRRTRTASLLFERDMVASYQWASNRGAAAKDAQGQKISVDTFRQMGLAQLDIARSDTRTGKMMRAYMAPQNEEERRIAALYMNPDYQGSLQGEAGAKEVGQFFLNPSSPLMRDIRRVQESIKFGAEAEKIVDDRLSGPPLSRQDKYFADRTRQRGALDAAQWNNVTQARRGSFQEFVKGMGEIGGTGAVQQKLRDLSAMWNASGKSQEEIQELEQAAVRQSIQDIIGQPRTTDRDFANWGLKHRPQDRLGRYGGVEMFPPHVWEKYRRATMSEDEKGIVEALESYLAPADGGSGATAPGDPHEFGGQKDLRWHNIVPGYKPGQGSSASPAPTDQSRLDRIEAALEKLVQGGIPVSVTVEDGLGQQLGHTTSRPRLLEQLNEAGIG